jgi:hypothetical protein
MKSMPVQSVARGDCAVGAECPDKARVTGGQSEGLVAESSGGRDIAEGRRLEAAGNQKP